MPTIKRERWSPLDDSLLDSVPTMESDCPPRRLTETDVPIAHGMNQPRSERTLTY